MEIIYFYYFNIFIIVPIFLYVGYIILKKYNYGTAFKILIVLFSLYLILINLFKLITIIKKIKTNKKFNEDLGLLIIFLACVFFAFSTYKIYKIKKTT